MRIALATCERPIVRDRDFDFLAAALRRRAAEAEAPAWTDESVEWSDFDLVFVSSTWDYNTQPDRFRKWLRGVERKSRLRNERPLIEWNLDKRYLRELEEAGVPTIPTIWTEPGAEDEIERTVAELSWKDVIVKPVVDLGAQRLARVETRMVARILRSLGEPGMAQPFLPSLQTEGEISLLYIAGEFAHALRKRPARGDFRVQQQYGGTHELLDAPPAALEIGRAALAAAPGEPVYARVDLVADERGRLRVIELELIEPHLYLDVEPRSAESLAQAILAAAS